MRSLVFHSSALFIIRAFPSDVKRSLGKSLRDLQKGCSLAMPVSRPMLILAQGAEELRIKNDNQIFRVFYYKKSNQGILIFHAFIKTSQKTSQLDIAIGRIRLKELLTHEKST
jgi:phage-related protein